MTHIDPPIEEVSSKTCGGCIYYRNFIRGIKTSRACHYLHDTGEPRGCPIKGCTRKRTKGRCADETLSP